MDEGRTPIPNPQTPVTQASEASSVHSVGGGQQPTQPGSSKARKHVTTACVRCRQAKARCNGANPCSRCRGRSVTCVYKFDEDDRSKAPLKRKLAELQGDSELLRDLLEHIRDTNDVGVDEVIRLIRSNASVHEIHQSLTQLSVDTLSRGGRLSAEVEDGEARAAVSALTDPFKSGSRRPAQGDVTQPSPARTVLSIERLTDTPTHPVSASPWTSVTADDHLVSHLVSLWATWDHLFRDGIVVGLLLRDMRARKIGASFCSPFLVNAILAAACPYSDYEEARTQEGKVSKLMELFVHEAKEHLEEEQFKPSVTTAQGLSVLLFVLIQTRQERRGFNLAVQATTMCAELLRNRRKMVNAVETKKEKDELAYVIDHTCWSVFSMTTASMLSLSRPHSLPEPARPMPDIEDLEAQLHQTQWLPYPKDGDEQNVFLDEIFREHAKLAVLEREMSLILYDDPDDTTAGMSAARKRALMALDTRLMSWFEKLPEYIKFQDRASPPSVVILSGWWGGVVMTMLMAQLQYTPGDERPFLDAKKPAPRERLVGTALQQVDLIRQYRSTFDLDRLNPATARGFGLALGILLEANSPSANGTFPYDAPINDICSALLAIARRSPSVATALRTIQLDAQHRGLRIPEATEKLFETLEQSALVRDEEQAIPNSTLSLSHRPMGWADSSSTSHSSQSQQRGQPETQGLTGFDGLDLQTINEHLAQQVADRAQRKQ